MASQTGVRFDLSNPKRTGVGSPFACSAIFIETLVAHPSANQTLPGVSVFSVPTTLKTPELLESPLLNFLLESGYIV